MGCGKLYSPSTHPLPLVPPPTSLPIPSPHIASLHHRRRRTGSFCKAFQGNGTVASRTRPFPRSIRATSDRSVQRSSPSVQHQKLPKKTASIDPPPSHRGTPPNVIQIPNPSPFLSLGTRPLTRRAAEQYVRRDVGPPPHGRITTAAVGGW
ncbi:hypothetical protein BU16DRAFT_522647 [Lophium mytilinum]|uniref:Uncharacterized protein n=1 Tax=Lophium mytilinum TaxID=390894 RepID=A0A6A6RDE6_9PEZI|nr:hypothetical protein BU16DRAFT_522647 [Lophium mytilinum]